MHDKFTKKMFQYFDRASEEGNSKKWFEANKEDYTENVKEPFEALLSHIDRKFAKKLAYTNLGKRKITRPLRTHLGNGVLAGNGKIVKNFTFITICEPNTSRFEWNPAFHFQFGANPNDNFIGVGIYMPSARQIREIREGFVNDYQKINRILTNKKRLEVWGSYDGEQYKRFPRGYDESSKAAKYLWYKQFHLTRHYKRSEIVRKDFFELVTNDIKLALPYHEWLRETVGVYPGGKQ